MGGPEPSASAPPSIARERSGLPRRYLTSKVGTMGFRLYKIRAVRFVVLDGVGFPDRRQPNAEKTAPPHGSKAQDSNITLQAGSSRGSMNIINPEPQHVNPPLSEQQGALHEVPLQGPMCMKLLFPRTPYKRIHMENSARHACEDVCKPLLYRSITRLRSPL